MAPMYRTVRVGALDIHYDLADYTPPWSKNPAETFLLYHGYARNMSFWQPWVPLLAGDYRVLRFDARGCGGTTQPADESTYSFDRLAGDAIGLMDVLGIERVHWVGESSGGIVGLTAALRHPDRIKTLTLCDTPFKRSQHITTTYTLGEGTRAAAFAKHGVGGWCRQTLSYRLDTSRASPEMCEWYIDEMTRRRCRSQTRWTARWRRATCGRGCRRSGRRRSSCVARTARSRTKSSATRCAIACRARSSSRSPATATE